MTVVHAMLGNAAVAVGLGLIALVVGYVCRSPAVRHAAWVLVLLKLVTPPLFSVPLPVLPASWEQSPTPAGTGDILIKPATNSVSILPAAVVDAPARWDRSWPLRAADLLLIVWVAGASVWFLGQGRRVVRFRRRVAATESAPPEVALAASRLATALGIVRPPCVKVALGIGSPMLWGWGRDTIVLFPRELLARLSPEARDTLLAHELAHFLRRDHWVRVLEFVATGLYWWHPAVWLARSGVEAAEEECCDAWVVGGLAASPRRYAEALLATVDFEAELRRPCLPPGACAATHSARLLRRRLHGILHTDRPHRLPGGTMVRAVAVAALLTQPVLRAASPESGLGSRVSGDRNPDAISESQTRESRPPLKPADPPAWATAGTPGGGLTVLACDRDVVLRRPDGTTRALGPGRPLALAFAPGNQRLATVGPGSLVRTWDEKGDVLAEARTPAAARAVAYTPDGNALLVLDAAGGITVLDPRTLSPVACWTVEGQANSIACSPDGRTVAVSFGSWLADTGWVECWSIPERRKVAHYPATAPVGAARFSPDGRTLVMGGWNGLVTWRSLPGGAVVAERQLPKHLVADAAFCPDAGTLPLEPPTEVAPPPTPVRPTVPEWVRVSCPSPER